MKAKIYSVSNLMELPENVVGFLCPRCHSTDVVYFRSFFHSGNEIKLSNGDEHLPTHGVICNHCGTTTGENIT